MPACTNDDAIIAKAEASLISTKPGAVPPHLDVGGHLPFGGTTHNGTGGRSAFGKRKIVTSAGTGNNPRALLLNYPPPPICFVYGQNLGVQGSRWVEEVHCLVGN